MNLGGSMVRALARSFMSGTDHCPSSWDAEGVRGSLKTFLLIFPIGIPLNLQAKELRMWEFCQLPGISQLYIC